MSNPIGRPTAYTKDIANEIITRMMGGESLNSVCKSENIPSKGTVLGWVVDKRDDFSDQYERALTIRAHGWAEEILDISDFECAEPVIDRETGQAVLDENGDILMTATQTGVSHARLRTDNRKWLVSKLLPRFSDKQVSELDDGSIVESVTVNIVNASSDKRK